VDIVKARLAEFLLKYGEKARALIEAIREASLRNDNPDAGDFSYKQVMEILDSKGYAFDPKNLLRILEKDYGLIETSFRTSSQHWWRVKAREILSGDEGADDLQDPRVAAIKIKAASLELQAIKRKLEFLLRKPILTELDKREFRRFSFNELNDIVTLLEEASQYEETSDVANELKGIISLAYEVGKRIARKANNKGLHEAKGHEENSHDNVLRLPDSEDSV